MRVCGFGGGLGGSFVRDLGFGEGVAKAQVTHATNGGPSGSILTEAEHVKDNSSRWP
jgi:hypothetical protein